MTEDNSDDMRDRMTRLETKMDLVLGQLTGTHADHETRLRVLERQASPDHEGRLRRLERTAWSLAGAAGAAGTGVGAAIVALLGGG